MSTVYNPQADLRAEIERLELEACDLRRRIQRAGGDADKVVLRQQLHDIEQTIGRLQARLD